MNRGKRAVYNSVASIASQIITMVCGFILPRLILSYFGSSYNGITASVTQFLSISSLLFAGIGGATKASFYKSLAKNDTKQISATVKATEIFMRKIAMIFVAIVIAFSVGYPYLVQNEFDWLFSSSLVLIISISTFVQYYFGITYQLLFQADQRQYVYTLLGGATIVLNTIIAVVLMKLGIGIHGVKLGSTAAYCITPLVLNVMGKKQYHIDKNVEPDFSSISQRWDAFFHQVAWFIHTNTDIAILTICTNTKEISVYSIYYLIAEGIKNVMRSLIVGVEAAFGNIMANHEEETLKEDVMHYETMLHVFSSIIFVAAYVLITPFVQVYTMGVTDVNYIRYTFGHLAIIGEMLYILRSPYEALINAAGHFKQTKKYAFIEVFINLTISIALAKKYGIIGVVIGTVVAISIRNICYGMYVSRNLIHRNCWVLLKRFLVTGLSMVLIIICSQCIHEPEKISYINWVIYAIEITITAIIITTVVNYLFFKRAFIQMLTKLINIAGRMKKTRNKKNP